MSPSAAYDEIADWYEREFQASTAAQGADPLGIDAALDCLLGPGTGWCLEVGCATGARAGRVRELGWIPFGVDISAAMLRYTSGRLPAVRADATRLPVRDGCLPAVLTVMAHTDMPAYPTVLAEAARLSRLCVGGDPWKAKVTLVPEEGYQSYLCLHTSPGVLRMLGSVVRVRCGGRGPWWPGTSTASRRGVRRSGRPTQRMSGPIK